jgi:predicted amidohydrolase YtcJ
VDLEVKSGKIVSISTSNPKEEIGRRDYDAQSCLVLPGLIDCHAHLFSLAMEEKVVKLRGVKSIKEMQKKIRARAKEPVDSSGWVIGRGWEQDSFAEKRMPNAQDLDEAISDTPAIMTRICGHIAVLNTAAIKKVSKELESFNDNLVPKDSGRRPTGIVKETALKACLEKVPKLSVPDLKRYFLNVQERCIQVGLCAVHCILSEHWESELACLRDLDNDGKIALRLSLFLPISALGWIEKLEKTRRKLLLEGKRYLVLGFKLFADGSLGAKTAALGRDYSDDPGNRGLLNYSTAQIKEYAIRVKRLGLIIATHAIGDRAIAQVIRAYKGARVFPEDGFRIEHCSVLTKGILNGIGGTTLCIQPMFSESDYWIQNRLGVSGDRFAYPFLTLSKIAFLIGGSDAPVEPLEPLRAISAAMKNRDERESLSLEESLELYTENAARASPITKNCGEIAVGRDCDLVILNQRNRRKLRAAKIRAVFLEGHIVSNFATRPSNI